MEFRHIRNNFNHPVATLAIEKKKKSTSVLSFAQCFGTDSFSYERGRELASLRSGKTKRSTSNNSFDAQYKILLQGKPVRVRNEVIGLFVKQLKKDLASKSHNKFDTIKNQLTVANEEIRRLIRIINELDANPANTASWRDNVFFVADGKGGVQELAL